MVLRIAVCVSEQAPGHTSFAASDAEWPWECQWHRWW